MNGEIHLHDVVALLNETAARHFLTGQPLLLRRGQIGVVVMAYDDTAFEIEFADGEGRAYAILPIRAEKLIVLHDTPEPVAA